VANWEGLALCEDYQTKGHGTKGKKTMGFLKDLFIAEISQLLQKRRRFWSLSITYLVKCVTYSLLTWFKRIVALYGIDWSLFGIHTTCHSKVMLCFVLTCKMKQNGY